jgi:small subunit ribosomal protein S6
MGISLNLKSKNMRNYELAFLLPPEIDEKKLKEYHQKINTLIENSGGILVSSIFPAKKTLFYPIKKRMEAFFGVSEFEIDPENLKDLEKSLKKDEEILRFLIVKKKPPKKLESPPKKSKKKIKLEEIDQKLKEILGETSNL